MAYQIGESARCAVVGYGSWATALVKILSENEPCVRWHLRKPQDADYLLRHKTNPRYLRDVHFDTERLLVSTDLNETVAGADLILLATPSIHLKTTLEGLEVALAGKCVVSAIKGIVPEENLPITAYLNQRYGVPFEQMGVITGPCHAEEVALERLSYLTVCCTSLDNALQVGRKIQRPYIRITPSTDLHGAEYASVLKNIYAIGVGIATGLGYGDNYLAVLISNAAMEMSRFLEQACPASRNLFASAYLGDLLVTSYSQFSRNRRLGIMVGKGYPVEPAQMEMGMVAEGYYVSACLHQLNGRFGVDMPIANAIYEMLYNRANPQDMLEQVSQRLI